MVHVIRGNRSLNFAIVNIQAALSRSPAVWKAAIQAFLWVKMHAIGLQITFAFHQCITLADTSPPGAVGCHV